VYVGSLITRAVKAANYDFNARLFHHKTVKSDDARLRENKHKNAQINIISSGRATT
jgi:hypothetical protein